MSVPDDFIDAFEWDGILFSKTQADHDAYVAEKASEGLFPKLTWREGFVRVTWVKKKKKLPKEKKNTPIDVYARNTARSLEADRKKDSRADWTRPRWKTGGNPGLFVEGGDCCPK
jgi:hypothetical protein